MDTEFRKIKEEICSRFEATVTIRKKPMFNDIIIKVPRINRGKLIVYILNNYSSLLKLRVDEDEILTYAYYGVSQRKMDEIQKDLKNHKRRFKWLYEQIKDEEVFIKNAKIIKED